MERACAGGTWGMAALRGLDLASVRSLLGSLATENDPLWIANINSADQIVVSGTRAALDTLRRHAPAAGARDLKILDVTVASHCPLQAGTARAVAAALGQVHHGDQRRAYFANTTGRRLAHATEKVIDDLAQAVQHPVRWLDAVRLMPELGVTAAIQTPPGHVLAAITARETPGVTSIAVDDTGLDTALRRTAGRDRNVTRLSNPAGTGPAATPGPPPGRRSGVHQAGQIRALRRVHRGWPDRMRAPAAGHRAAPALRCGVRR